MLIKQYYYLFFLFCLLGIRDCILLSRDFFNITKIMIKTSDNYIKPINLNEDFISFQHKQTEYTLHHTTLQLINYIKHIIAQSSKSTWSPMKTETKPQLKKPCARVKRPVTRIMTNPVARRLRPLPSRVTLSPLAGSTSEKLKRTSKMKGPMKKGKSKQIPQIEIQMS